MAGDSDSSGVNGDAPSGVVREIFRMSAAGMSIGAITAYLKDRRGPGVCQREMAPGLSPKDPFRVARRDLDRNQRTGHGGPGLPAPGGADQRESQRGPWLRCGGHGGRAACKVFRVPVPENNPADTRGRLSLTKRSVTRKGARGSPRNGRPSRRLWDALSRGRPATAKGRVGRRRNVIPVADRARGRWCRFSLTGIQTGGCRPYTMA